MKSLLRITFFVFLIQLSTGCFSQEIDTLKVYQVETVDGNIYTGNILSKDEKAVVLKTEMGILNIPFKNVKLLKEVKPDELVKGEVWYENPHASRYFYLPNGYGLKKGEGYYQNTWVLFNQLSYGFSNNFSVGVGMIPTFLFGANGMPMWITPKFSIPVKPDQWNIGLGAIAATYVGEPGSPVIGMVYGVSTFGSRDKNFTVGTGFAFADNEWSSTPVISLGGTYRTGKKHYLVMENYLFVGDHNAATMLWLGGRFANRRIAIDYGGILPIHGDMQDLIIIPWLSITLPFGTKQHAYIPAK